MKNEENQQSDRSSLMSKVQALATPIAIIIGFGLIASAIYFSGSTQNENLINPNDQESTESVADDTKGRINPITDDEHIVGNPEAPIVLIEYSDYDCPFCRLFHDTMSKIMDEYADTGKVAWAYRQFPIQSLHPDAPLLSEASECVAKLGGNEAFWKFTDALNASRQITLDAKGQVTAVEPTDTAKIPDFVATAGISTSDYEACMENASGRAAVEEDFNNGIAIGVTGTPHTVVLFNGNEGVINGAQPYENVKQMIESLLKQID